MKRQHCSSSSLPTSSSNFEILDDFEPVQKRTRTSSSTLAPHADKQVKIVQEDKEPEVVIDEPTIPIVIFQEQSLDMPDNDDDIIEIEPEDLNISNEPNDSLIIVVSDSEFDDEEGIDVTGIVSPVMSPASDTSIASSTAENSEVVQEADGELSFIDHEYDREPADNEGNRQFAEIVISDSESDSSDDESIDVTGNNPRSAISSSIPVERKLPTNVEQCPICLETVTDLQRLGVHLVMTQCHHVMCTLCARQLLSTSSRCPLCRESVRPTTLVPFCILP